MKFHRFRLVIEISNPIFSLKAKLLDKRSFRKLLYKLTFKKIETNKRPKLLNAYADVLVA